VPTDEKTLKTADFPGVVEAARAYLEDRRVRSAVFAVATPVDSDWVHLTNSPWAFSIEATRDALGLDDLAVINDFVAQALAVPQLGPEDLIKVGGGEPAPDRPIGVIGAGTGLGVAGLLPVVGGWQPVASEGGHVSFAPHDEVEAAMLGHLRQRFGHVSNERLMAGPGLVNLAHALAGLQGRELEPLTPAQVVQRARQATCPYCVEAVQRFPPLLGGAAGDLALMFCARGGVFIAGGVCPRLGELFDVERFRARFIAKGRFEDYLRPIPTYLVTRPDTGLLGAAALLVGLRTA
jgi:glucokinase